MEQLKQLSALLSNKPSPNDDVDLETLTKGDAMSSRSLLKLGLGFEDLATILQIIRDLGSGKPINDRDLLLEKVVSLLQRLPTGGLVETKVSDALITGLWHDLPHPAGTLCGPEYRYRRADGSANNPFNHTIGAACQPYARTVPPMKPKSPYLPDPEAVFDQLLRRRSFTPHKAGLNRFFFSFATTVIHECFQSDYQKPWINQTSSYVELSSLYGNNQDEQDKIRTFVQGRIYPDTISSVRLMLMPPGAVAIMMMFSRHHNYLAERMFAVNEGGKYKPWDECTDDEKAWQDNDIFQLCRNINVAFYAKTVLTDYVSAILNTIRANSEWHLELGKEIKSRTGARVERGTGNTVTCEFNVLYHWHSILSASDDKWMVKEIKDFYPDVDPEDLTPEQFGRLMHTKGKEMTEIPPCERTFYGLQRNEDGYFDDDKLADLLKNCTEEPARASGARGTPSSLKVVELMGQLQARNTFHCSTMNEFREYLHLKKFDTFLEWNPDPEVAAAAERLYGHVDNLELYPGLMAEEAKPNVPGSGVQMGHTIGRGILDDAIALVRGDRFLTYDLNADTLSSWGLAQIKGVPGAYGGHLATVLSRALPAAWGHGRSPYNLLPFYTPVAIEKILTDNGVVDQYDLTRPPPSSNMHCFSSFLACKKALADPVYYATQYGKNAGLIAGTSNFFMAWDDVKTLQSSKDTLQKAFMEPGFDENLRESINALTLDKIGKDSLAFDKPATRHQLNVIRDVFNVVPIIWLADKFGIPLRSQEKPHGLMTVAQLHAIMVAFYVFITFDVMPTMSWRLHEAAERLAPPCRKIIETRYNTTGFSATQKITDFLTKGSSYELSKSAHHFYSTMHKAKFPMDAAVDAILGIMLPTAATIAWQCSLLLDLFLSPGYEYAKDRLCELAKRQDEESWLEFTMWVYEGMRVRPHLPGVVRTVLRKTTMQDGDCTVSLNAADQVLLCKATACMDPIAFPNPQTLDPSRPMKSYLHLDIGMRSSFGAPAAAPAIVAMLRPVFQLRNLRRAKGTLGQLITVREQLNVIEGECHVNMYVDDLCNENIVPTSMVIEYDSP